MDEWISKRDTLITVARETQLASNVHALVEYDPRITEYPVHSNVFFTPPVGRSNKLLPRHRSSYQAIYVIENLVSGKRNTTHIHNLRPFNYDPAYTSPLVVAQHNEQEFIVESIITHRGSRNRRSNLEFQVQWLDSARPVTAWNPTKP